MKPTNITMINGYGNNTPTPEDLWQTPEMFINDYLDFPFASDIGTLFTEADLTDMFWRFISRYDESHYNYKFDDKCKLKTFAIIHEQFPILVQRLKIQDRMIKLTDSEIFETGKIISKSAQNPDKLIDMGSTDLTEYADAVNINLGTQAKLPALREQYLSIVDNLWDDYLNLFSKLFKKFMIVPFDKLYITEYEGEDNE